MAGPELTNRGPSRWEPVAQAQRPRPCEIRGEVGGPARLCHGRWPPQCLTLRQIVQGLCGWKIAMKKKKKARGVPAAGGKRLRRGAGRRKRGPGCLVKPPQCLAVSHRQTRPLCSDNGQGNVSDGRRGQCDLNRPPLHGASEGQLCPAQLRRPCPRRVPSHEQGTVLPSCRTGRLGSH